MPQLILLNKPYGVICQFSPSPPHASLADFVPIKDVYPAGRLDTDSEGLLLLTDSGPLQARIADPKHKLPKTYWVQVEGSPSVADLQPLLTGVDLGDFVTQPAQVQIIPEPENLWPRVPPVRFRANVPTTWLEVIIREGKNRQVRRMTAKVGFPTLRLVRYSIGEWSLDQLPLGTWRAETVAAPRVVQVAADTARPKQRGRRGPNKTR